MSHNSGNGCKVMVLLRIMKMAEWLKRQPSKSWWGISLREFESYFSNEIIITSPHFEDLSPVIGGMNSCTPRDHQSHCFFFFSKKVNCGDVVSKIDLFIECVIHTTEKNPIYARGGELKVSLKTSPCRRKKPCFLAL